MNRNEFAAQEGRLAEGQEKEMKYTVPGNSPIREPRRSGTKRKDA